MRSYVARHGDDPRTLLLLGARLGPHRPRRSVCATHRRAEHPPARHEVIEAQHGRTGLHYLDYRGETVAW